MPRKQQPLIAVYTGQGASHSWTWFADIFEREHIDTVTFIDEQSIAAGALDVYDVLFVSGGDTFAIAGALGEQGARAVERFITGGGMYIGACAGAYLLLKSSLAPLHHFNFVEAKIANLTRCLPPALQRPEKYCTAYGCRYVYHPVRGDVLMRWSSGPARSLTAPLYGGGAMFAGSDIEVLATYEGLTAQSELLVEEAVARETLIGNAAAARKRYGQGLIYLFGPHFEHPGYPDANRIIFDCIDRARRSVQSAAAAGQGVSAGCPELRAFMSSVSNARIVGLALERSSYQWLIGAKVYDPEKIRIFLETIWKRASRLEKRGLHGCCDAAELERLRILIDSCTQSLRALRRDAQCGRAEELFADLRRAAASFVNMYFDALRCCAAERGAAVPACPDKSPLQPGTVGCHTCVEACSS